MTFTTKSTFLLSALKDLILRKHPSHLLTLSSIVFYKEIKETVESINLIGTLLS